MFGVWAPGEDVAKLTYYGLYALQHRGQEAAGIAVSDGAALVVYKDLGLVAQVFDEPTLDSLRGHIAIGHCRYSTTGSSTWENAQPTFRTTRTGTGIALGHNGNLVNTAELAAQAARARGRRRRGATTDSDLITGLLAAYPDLSVEAAAMKVLPTLRGAFSLVFMDEHTLYAARDGYGVRPLVLGRLDRGWVVASETAALDIVGASFVREVEPGELIAIDERRAALGAVRPADAEGLPVRVRVPGPAGHHDRRPERARRPGRGRPPAGPRAPGRGRPGHPGARSPAPRRRSASPRQSGIPYGLGLVKNSYVGPHVHPAVARRSGSSASGSSSTRCGTCCGASGSSWSTTRSCAATPSGRWSGCCASPARSRCTSGSPRRR